MATDAFVRTRLQEVYTIRSIVSLHYFEFSKDFRFQGERHDFWELVYVDKGEIDVFADQEGYSLQQGDVIFHKPDEFHGVWANSRIAPNVVIVSFVSHSKAMSFFAGKIFKLNAHQHELLAQLMKNGFAAFEPPYDDPYNHTLRRRSQAPLGAEQMIKLYLEMLLISLSQDDALAKREQRLSSATKQRSEAELAQRMQAYMAKHLLEDLRLEQIHRAFNLSRSHALHLFKSHTGQSIMKYYRGLKIELAKTMIREQQHNVTEIAERLCYSSVHTFSRHFKLAAGMSPSEYAKSVLARM